MGLQKIHRLRSWQKDNHSKPLVSLFSKKRLPSRILHFCLRLSRFDYKIEHVPGKLLYTADTLSRSPISSAEASDLTLQEEAELLAAETTGQYTENRHLQTQTARRSTCCEAMKYCKQNWPTKHKITSHMKPYWAVQNALTVNQGLLMYNCHIVVPVSLHS